MLEMTSQDTPGSGTLTTTATSVSIAKSPSPPSLVLSPFKSDPSENTPSAHDSKWRVNSTGQLESIHQGIISGLSSNDAADKDTKRDETSPLDTSSSSSSISQNDDVVVLSHNLTLHSRESSTISSNSASSSRAPQQPSGASHATPTTTSYDRPHSFSGGISQSDLRRLQNLPTKGQPPSPTSSTPQDALRASPPRETPSDVWVDATSAGGANSSNPRFPTIQDQLTSFPTIMTNPSNSSPPRSYNQNTTPTTARPEVPELSVDYNAQPRQFNGPRANAQSFTAGTRPSELQYHPPQRVTVSASYAMPPVAGPVQSPGPYSFPQGRQQPMPAQPFYELVHSPPPVQGGPHDPSANIAHRPPPVQVAPTQAFRGTHQHSLSDPANLRDANSIAMMNAMGPYVNMGMPGAGMYTPAGNNGSPLGPVFPGFTPTNPQFYASPDAFGATPDVALLNAMGRLAISPQFPGTAAAAAAAAYLNGALGVDQTGPSANNRKLGLYKTELCRSWEEKGSCRYGQKCQFAHGEEEIRKVSRHPKYKTEICRTFWVSGSCPYGKRCCFIHTELPASGTPPGADGSSPPRIVNSTTPPLNGQSQASANRTRSMSNASESEAPISLLQRISAQRDREVNGNSPGDVISPGGFQFAKPALGSLRVDTASLNGKTNYPLTSNPAINNNAEHHGGLSPVPATAGPDFGRQATARNDVVGYSIPIGSGNQRIYNGSKTNGESNTGSNLRHSFNGTDAGVSIQTSITNSSGHTSPFGIPATPTDASFKSQTPTQTAGHQRSGSASGQWTASGLAANASRSGSSTHLSAATHFISSTTPTSNTPSPWGAPELTVNKKRLSGGWL
ncbi:hypothetical protein SISNIDRAFT_99942 [Sistotremastrum niveocremeum HHB9708]|uniref:C3H1-type domain-containing protein n=1 Tax=Sistotremastrum niveocremeum HHB9708 TaxID=1314777 RepID=A0A164UB56_9AGAM|nr:hypothetical protein SISNIDRAFT_99942 [Sistotremastrum niveocremeum HHB9708]